MCLGLATGYKKQNKESAPASEPVQDKTKEMKAFICRRCGIYHAAVCEKCKIHTITKIEVKDNAT